MPARSDRLEVVTGRLAAAGDEAAVLRELADALAALPGVAAVAVHTPRDGSDRFRLVEHRGLGPAALETLAVVTHDDADVPARHRDVVGAVVGGPVRVEPMTGPGGTTGLVALVGSGPDVPAGPEPVVWAGLAAALLERHRLSATLRDRDASLDLTLDLSSGGTWSIEMSDGRMVLDGRDRSPFYPGPEGSDRLDDVLAWVPEPDRGEIIERIAAMAADPQQDRAELEFRTAQPDGSVRWLHAAARAERDDAGALARLAGIVVDITERKQRELEAIEISSMLQAALAAMSEGVFILDQNGNFTHFNDAFVRFCRFGSRDEMLATLASDPTVLEMILPGGQRLAADQGGVSRAMRGEADTDAEYLVRRNDLGESWVGSFNYAPIRSADGTVVGSVVTARDVTEARRTQRLLQESEARLSSIIDTAAEAIVVIDEQGFIQSVNRATVAMFGHPAEDLIGQEITVFMPAGRHAEHLQAYYETGDRKVIGIGREVQGRHRDGTLLDVDLSVAEWFDADGRRFFTGLMRDISERRRTEHALTLARRLETVGRLAAGVSHDFNNLLTVIGGNLELIEARTSDERTRMLLRRALDAVELGASFNRRLLSMAQRRTLEPRPVQVAEQIADLVDLLGRTLGEHIELVTESDRALWPVVADPGELDSAVLNLVMNARDALVGGGQIVIRSVNERIVDPAPVHPDARPGDYVCLSVIDTGTGMTDEVLARALEPFFSTKPAGSGSGLGLSSVAEFARGSGGFLTITSRLGEGTGVHLHLPRGADDHAGTDSPARAAAAGSGAAVLVVEDDDALREMTLDRLESLGYRASGVRSVAEAQDRLNSGPAVDIVLSDIALPGGRSGLDLARWVAEAFPTVAVVLSSGYSETARPADDDGLLDRIPFLAKPYGREQLAEVLRSSLMQR
jgi:PAS domain S-box-containing protein